ncbi:MAG: hypothetical protein JSW63_00880 [Ignavibacterium sp.]|nr:MAG: hypothetical protein JSW63_00880 [Ignavibacterium sp.]
MKHLTKTLITHLIILTSFLLCSCGASHSIRENVILKDDSFSYNHLINKDVVNSGVFSQLKDISYDDKIEASFLLSNILYEKLKDVHQINMITTGQFINNISKENYLIIMENFETEEILNIESIGFIKETMPDLNYLILAYITNENIYDYSDTERVKDEKGEEQYKTDYEKTYLLTVEFQLYDIPQEFMVYNIVVYNQAERTESRTTDTGCCEGGISNLISNILQGPPAEIGREEVLAKIYERFAEELMKVNN